LKEENKPVNVLAGFQYKPAKQFSLKAGLSTATAQPFAGVFVQWKEYRILVSVAYHTQLGASTGLGLLLHNPQTENDR
jgi:hypothetical protein